MSVHDSMLIADFFLVLERAVNDFFLLGVIFWFSLSMPAAILDHADRPIFKNYLQDY